MNDRFNYKSFILYITISAARRFYKLNSIGLLQFWKLNVCIMHIWFVLKLNHTLNFLYKEIMPKDAVENIQKKLDGRQKAHAFLPHDVWTNKFSNFQFDLTRLHEPTEE